LGGGAPISGGSTTLQFSLTDSGGTGTQTFNLLVKESPAHTRFHHGKFLTMKLIFGDGDRESEIFLHINASIKKGQFSMKDPRFGDLALAELAKVL
jgi:hypothetical protein